MDRDSPSTNQNIQRMQWKDIIRGFVLLPYHLYEEMCYYYASVNRGPAHCRWHYCGTTQEIGSAHTLPRIQTVTGTKQTHKTINSTVCGTPSCVAADKKAHFSKRWDELRISRERQWLTALLCFPLYWVWVKVVDVDLPSLPILINLQQEAGRILRAPQMRNCFSTEQKYFTWCNLSCGVYMHIAAEDMQPLCTYIDIHILMQMEHVKRETIPPLKHLG